MNRNLLKALLAPVGTAMASVLTLGSLVVAARNNEFAGIAGYGAGLSIGALVAALAGGGTSLAYISGEIETRRAVRSVRLCLVAPIIAVAVLVSAPILTKVSNVPLAALLAGGLAALVNNASEIEAGYLKRQLRTPELLTVDLFARVVGLLLILGDAAGYPSAMASVAILRFTGYLVCARDDPSRGALPRTAFLVNVRAAYKAGLVSMSLLYVLIDRSVFVAAPLIVLASSAGKFSTAMSIQQAAAMVLVSGLHTVLARRSELRDSPAWILWFEWIMVASALLSTLGLILAFAPSSAALGLPATNDFRIIWTAVMLALPFAVFNRMAHFRLIALRQTTGALWAVASSCTVMILLCLFAISTSGDLKLLATAPLLSEAAGLCIALPLLVRNGRPQS